MRCINYRHLLILMIVVSESTLWRNIEVRLPLALWHHLVLRINSEFCPVSQVKFMKNKPGAALVEMGDYYAADRAITHLNNTFLFSQRINLWWAWWLIDDIDSMVLRCDAVQTCDPTLSRSVSKQLAIRPGYCYELEDGTGSYKDFHSSRNNRFTFRKEADKIRIQHPSNILYFFNAPPDVTPEVFSKVRRRGCFAVCHSRRAWLTKTNPCRRIAG